MKKFLNILSILGLCFSICGCRTVEVYTETEYLITQLPESSQHGVYHKVKKGETLWRIAQAYDIAIADILDSNNVDDVAQIEKGQMLFMPGAYSVKQILIDTDKTKREFIWPLKGEIISSFNDNKNGYLNRGIDIEAIEGEVVRASRAGQIVFADSLSGYGKTVIIDHRDGYFTTYSQMSTVLVRVGESVIKNKDLGYIGRYHAQRVPYLHFEIRKKGVEDNPMYYLP
ncbi:MAG: peptidoglycan DD-metalloendopeptidase family protein [Candidatus Omnitrophica bacterium]|nr:peptidoglycan DD-metalloendopeptidase family protein [Candidatus Omnitrophota bacterium]